jgi:hypothetical protein
MSLSVLPGIVVVVALIDDVRTLLALQK